MLKSITHTVLTLLAVVVLLAPLAQAKEGHDGDHKRHGKTATDQTDSSGHDKRARDMRQRAYKALFKGIELTEDQKQQVKDIFKQTKEEHDAWRQEQGQDRRDKMSDLREQMRSAREAKDEDRAKELREQIGKLFEYAPKWRDSLDKIAKLLDEEQREQFAKNRKTIKQKMGDNQGRKGQDDRGKHMLRRIRRMLFKELELTKEQRQQIRDIMEPLKEDRQAWEEANKEKREALRKQMKEARKDHDEDKIKQLREQMKQLRESSPKPDAKFDQIASDVLTEGQREQFATNRQNVKKCLKNHRPGKGKHGPRHEGDKGDKSGDDDQKQKRNRGKRRG